MASESTRKDPAWKYAHQLDPKNPNQFKCNFCGKVSNGGVYRVKQHLVGGSRNVTVCQKCPLDVREEIKEYMGNKKTQKDQMNLLPHIDEMNNDFEEDEDDIAYEIQRPRGSSSKALPSNQNSYFAGSKRLKKKGPMDVFYTPNPDFVVQNRKGKQTTTSKTPSSSRARPRGSRSSNACQLIDEEEADSEETEEEDVEGYKSNDEEEDYELRVVDIEDDDDC
ncbi:general transcription factor IIF subunit 1-like [Camellia sinensis]|uniref:general transcription factor IIF subunit 1-like n=1 Tax=Camellia sinensis TaxID=4442 RepID=UPI001036A520|nr:general transcription factor IIF subunit 1-like [Camellia sinensis]